ncbi:Oidioi.mRNA.OKI2018_I69.chr1.g1738.t1.cds [Oikopleura dioica]|uniref:Oidioi.mRNA.OKI2018_I69.chr1.g1738.t1.cds n=1 Tax=Oikopleura dioica TaxID=34765 RepID=A0ABN7STV9_OIKDI|nr:Oidioi.mRNA.OKI2018_I69.chr1.g1738.t1.cds [Oikopleura dioica]
MKEIREAFFLLSLFGAFAQECPDADLGEDCKDICRVEFTRCRLLCESDYCLSICEREYEIRKNACPCEIDCPLGCESCENKICPEIIIDPCADLENCETFVDNRQISPSFNNTIAEIYGEKRFRISAEVYCNEIPGFDESDQSTKSWRNIVHVNTGQNHAVPGDRYFALFLHLNGTMKIVGPLKEGYQNMAAFWTTGCTTEEWNTYGVQQIEKNGTLELSLSIDDEVLGTFDVEPKDAFSGKLFVNVANKYHSPADFFPVRNFYHQTFQ